MKLFRRPIEGESYSLPVVAIEAVVVQIVTELWRACGGDLTSFKAAPGFTGEFRGRFFSSVAEDKQNPWT